ncbi:translocation and assembly module lipoprotein TamL [Gallalistipes aquisgranensis]|uniref:translocation and assembly module lipoprotein TamL n=1 Tax=Gallalistipes aquisgranensis TaxID=2779358 RepID=UPI001CF88482|nr:BamA/TamA family outer membrane protein [Gallalistipes aquisgranensis]MBE5032442.1 BamA/TamA family outer membrane protein [Gallalistipes aquisgranensis]
MNRTLRYLFPLLCAALLAACSTTRRLGEGEVLYTGVKKMKITEAVDSTGRDGAVPGDVVSAVKEPLSVAPNNTLYTPWLRTPFPLGLWAYNHLYTPKEKGFKYWLYGKLSKEPVLISRVQPELRLKVVEELLGNHGYFGAETRYEFYPRKRNPKAGRVGYWVHIPLPYHLDSIAYLRLEGTIGRLVDSLRASSLIRKGMRYDLDTLTGERKRISDVLRNRGFYYFRPEYIEYQADTTQGERQVALRMRLRPGVPAEVLKPYRVGQVNLSLRNVTPGPWDTMRLRRMEVDYQKPLRIRPRVLARAVGIHPGDTFTVEAQNTTQTNLNKLGIFRYVNLNVPPVDSLRGADSLDITIDAALDKPLEAELEVDVSSKSNSFIGPGVIFSLRHNNIFRGGEVLTLKLNGNYEWQTGSRKQADGTKSSLLNSYEFGLNMSLGIPRLTPRFLGRRTRYSNRTTFQIGVDLMNRPQFFHMVSFNASAGFDFQTSPYSFHSLSVLKLVYNNLLSTTASFDRTMDENPAIALSFRNQFIPSVNYVYTFDRSYGARQKDRFFFQASATSAGNLLWAAMETFGKKGSKYLFGNQFSQFVKGVLEFKEYHRLGRYNTLASRLLVGAGWAYGNSSVMPYSEQFYIGGANSIRAFTIRSLGPGSYRPPEGNSNRYLDQTGDFKLEANIELRFRMMGRLNGAVFVDAGNIWLLKNDPQRPGGVLTAKGFFNDIALGTGFGLRYDISYLVLRADLGIGIHTPYPNPDKRGYYNIQSFKDGLGFHLAIGYPF